MCLSSIPIPLVAVPHEKELLFPPLTALECRGYSQHGTKRLVAVQATVSTARPDTSFIVDPTTIPPIGQQPAEKDEGYYIRLAFEPPPMLVGSHLHFMRTIDALEAEICESEIITAGQRTVQLVFTRCCVHAHQLGEAPFLTSMLPLSARAAPSKACLSLTAFPLRLAACASCDPSTRRST